MQHVITAPIEGALQAELISLREQVAEQARRLAEQQQLLEGQGICEAVVKHMRLGVMVLQLERPGDPTSFRIVGANATAQRFLGFDLEAEIGNLAIDAFPGALESGLPQLYATIVQSGQRRNLGEVPYHDDRVGEGFFTIEAIPLSHNRLCVVFENITERKRAEQALQQSKHQEELIQAQAAALAELSTPLIPINDKVMVMPLIGAIDSRRAQQVIETLLEGISTNRASVVILDITGVPMVDTQVANALLRAAQSVKLLGAEVVLTGIRPEVAQTLVGLGADLGTIITRSSLQNGIAYATAQGASWRSQR
ncbi:MAG TPA: STAS domain-containing protein [Roseiflexaceae bacterium]|nr:STAS domain-containing protein [Roseiflexaceae bacterium]